MKQFKYIFAFVMTLVVQLAVGQQITVAEYFWDTDPGQGNGTALTLNNCSDTSLCVTVDNADIDQHFLETISLYPNPSHGEFSIDLGDVKSEVSVTMRDARGRLLQVYEYQNKELIKLFVDYPSGVYFLEITASNENAILRLVID